MTNQTRGRNWVTGSTWGKTQQNRSIFLTYRPLLEGASLRRRNNRGRDRWDLGRRLGRRTDTGRWPADRVQGGVEGGRSQGGDRRDLEYAAPGGTQATAIMVTHGGPDRGRSHGGGRADDSRGPTNSGRAGGGGARGRDREPMSQGDEEDPEGQGGTDGSGDRCGGGDPEGHGGAGVTED